MSRKIKLLGLIICLLASFQLRAEITFTPAKPVVEMEEKIEISVSGTVGELTWSAQKGWIEGSGTTVTYVAPSQPGLDVVVVMDAEANVATVKIQINVSLENAVWEVIASRYSVSALALSKDKAILWVGTWGGLEKRKASTGELEKVYLNTDGLPHNEVNALLSDEQGGVWVGTSGGLAHLKADGTWEVFNEDNSDLPSAYVNALLSDDQGGVWVGTSDAGLAHLKADGTWEVFNEDNSDFTNDYVTVLLSDDQEGVWIGAYYGNSGLAHLKADGTWQVFNEDNSYLPSNRVIALLSDDQGGVWVGTDGGLAHLKSDGTWEVFYEDISDLPDNDVMALLSDDQGGVWVGTREGGLAHLKADGSWQVNSELPSNYFTVLLSDEQGGIWIGGGGITHLKADGTWQLFYNSDIPNNNVEALLSDDQGGIWVGTNGGLAHLKADGSSQFFNTYHSNLPNDDVKTLLSDDQGGVWVGTSGGLAHLKADGSSQFFYTDALVHALASDGQGGVWVINDGDVEHLKADGSLYLFLDMYFPINAFLSDAQGGIWIGSGGDINDWLGSGGDINDDYVGLVHFKADGSWQVFNTDNSNLPDNDVRALLSDDQGGIWIGTFGGLAHRKADGTWIIFDHYNSHLPSNLVTAIFSDEQGGVWVGTSGGGIAHRKADGSWLVFNKNNSNLPANYVRALLSDEQGGVWVGTYGHLAHLKADGTWEVFNDDNSDLPGDEINALISDDQGGVWVGTYGHLAHLKADGTWEVFNDDNSDLPNEEITALISDDQGGVWVGTYDAGLAHLKADGSFFNEENSTQFNFMINALLSDDQGGVWVGTRYYFYHIKKDGTRLHYNWGWEGSTGALLSDDQGGVWAGGASLYHINADATRQFIKGPSLDNDVNVNALLSDDQGEIWIGTDGGGIAHRKADGSWLVFNEDNSNLPDNDVRALLSDDQGGIWIGTDGGLARLKADNSWQVFNTENSNLPDNVVKALLSDAQGGIWVGTDGGGLAHLKFGEQQSGKRAAIIIAGGGNQSTNALWDTTESISTYFYKMLNKRKFVNSEIYYLSSKPFADFNGDGFDDRIVDAPRPARPISLDDVKGAFKWAKEQGKLNQPLYLFFIDHGGDGKVQLAKNTTMSAQELKGMLDDYQQATGNQVVLILEACYSGSFLPLLAAPNRAIISSAKGNELAYFENEQGFSRFFTQNLLRGMNFLEAFDYSVHQQGRMLTKMDERLAGSAEYVATTQSPQCDDNGDGVYNTSDGQWLKQLMINGNIKMADFTLAVNSLTTSSLLQVGQAFSLSAKASTASGQVKRVWAVIRPPRINLVIDSNGTPILAYPTLELSQTEDKAVWTGSWNEALYNGDYEISFYAKDNEGNIEMSEESIMISVNGGIDSPSSASVEVVIEKVRYTRGESFKFELVEQLGWGYDLYVAIVLPDDQFITLEGPNQFAQLNHAEKWRKPLKYNEKVTAIDLTLPPDLALGTYCLYGILSPQGEDPSAVMDKWVSSQQCFEVM